MSEVLATIGTLTGFSIINIIVIMISTKNIVRNKGRIQYMLLSSISMVVVLLLLILTIANEFSGVLSFVVTGFEYWFLAMAFTLIVKGVIKLYNIPEVITTAQAMVTATILGILGGVGRTFQIGLLTEFVLLWIVLVPFVFLIYYLKRSHLTLKNNVFFYQSLLLIFFVLFDVLYLMFRDTTFTTERFNVIDYLPIIFGAIIVLSMPTAFLSELQREESSIYLDENISLNQTVETVTKLSYIDPLTGLFNRRKANELLLEMISNYNSTPKTFSIIISDVNRFKHINDTFGHLLGDQVLTYVGTILNTHTRSIDQVMRFGGDEFMILLPNTNKTQALEVIEHLKRQFETNKCDSVDSKITLSFGSSEYTERKTLNDLLHEADRNMYLDKEAIKANQL